jgi:arsenite-transporting ATPase
VRDGAGDPTRRYYVGKPQDVFRRDDHYVLSIPLPLVDRDEVHLHRSVFDELVVRIGNWRRNIALPLGLAKLDVAGARYEEDRLNIYFAVPAEKEIPAEQLKPNTWEALKSRLGVKRADARS